jgi:asparagine synthase (glutamine-hydrolysing)
MCGFVGIVDIEGIEGVDRNLLVSMNELVSHRGPDETGLFHEDRIGFGHKRLSIIDLASGQQPMHSADDSVVLVYNGEIYNFQEIATQLKQFGYTFKTHCDTEVIIYAWMHWGEECVNHFRGMFAFALWDRSKQSLFLARDRLGVKPLFYSKLTNGQFIFGSELKSLIHHPKFNKTTSARAVEDYFAFGYIPFPNTIFDGTYKLGPGHVLSVDMRSKKINIRKYWDVSFHEDKTKSEQQLSEELVERVRDAVKVRLIAEVPLGAFLSGGVDSSIVVATMADLLTKPVNTCSISFGDPEFNESAYAQKVANKFNTNHSMEQVESDDFSLIDKLAWMYDEPFADSSAMPTYRVCELARKKVTVALSGDGGDELFAGYRRYRWHMLEENVRSCLPSGLRRSLFGMAGEMYPKMDWAPKIFRAKTTLQGIARDSLNAYFHTISVTGDRLRNQMYSKQLKDELAGYSALEVFKFHQSQADIDHPLALVQYLDLKTYLEGDILTKVDRASMANSLEVRVPLLDHKLVEWGVNLPSHLKLRQHQGKYLLKKAFENKIDQDILYRPKMGFAVPIEKWFRGPLKERVREALLGDTLRETNLFDMKFLAKMIEQHQSGMKNYTAPIWTLLMFESFQRQIFAN